MRSLICAGVSSAEVWDVSDLTDNITNTKQVNLSSGRNPISADEYLADVKRNLYLDASEPDVKLRNIILQISYIALSKLHGRTFYGTTQKAAVHFIAVLQPSKLKNRI